MVVFKFNPAETGLRKTLKEYEEIALQYIWSLDDEGAGSGKTWIHVNKELSEGKSISRASVIYITTSQLVYPTMSLTNYPRRVIS